MHLRFLAGKKWKKWSMFKVKITLLPQLPPIPYFLQPYLIVIVVEVITDVAQCQSNLMLCQCRCWMHPFHPNVLTAPQQRKGGRHWKNSIITKVRVAGRLCNRLRTRNDRGRSCGRRLVWHHIRILHVHQGPRVPLNREPDTWKVVIHFGKSFSWMS